MTTPSATMLAKRVLKKAGQAIRKANQLLFEQPLDQLLDSARQFGTIAGVKTNLKVTRHEQFSLLIQIHNNSTEAWSTRGSKPVKLLLEWKSRQGKTLFDQPRAAIPLLKPVRPQEQVKMRIPIQALHSMGNFRLEIGIGQELENPFEVPSATIDIDINEVGKEFDYHKFFASFDLDQDYWTVVGPTTQDEYHLLAKIKLQHLIDLGLTPDSRVLDVGCGTGQLASALIDYLSENGKYWGAELTIQGVEWCRRKYLKPNFHFFQNRLTSIPIADQEFDFITYFSVFTHTYPEENRQLLIESKRLLAPTGCIFADFFTSDVVEHFIGHRNAVENNHEKLLNLIAEVGLHCEEVFTAASYTYGKRRFLKLTKI